MVKKNWVYIQDEFINLAACSSVMRTEKGYTLYHGSRYTSVPAGHKAAETVRAFLCENLIEWSQH
jgi:hypothetical protein